MYCDSHAHLTSSPLFHRLDAVLANAQAANITQIINICTDQNSLEKGLELAKNNPWIFNAAATHPHDVEKEGEDLFPIMSQAALLGKIVAVGEIGLDYHYMHSSKEVQKQFLRRYLQLAIESHLPVIIHCREAFSDFFNILDTEYKIGGNYGPGVLHCFTGTLAEAEQVLKRDWYLSLSGIVTFKKSAELREVAKIVPLERLLIETDAPYLAPQSHRGKENEPAFLPETAEVIATVKGISLAELAHATLQNTCRLFKIGDRFSSFP